MYEIYYLLLALGLFYWIQPTKEPVKALYEDSYPLTGTAEETDENKKNKVVSEITPEGRVILQWDGVFNYWSQNPKQYRYLETVARKYVLIYDCKEHYLHAQYDRAPPPKKLDKVFAVFKSYSPTQVIKTKTNIYKWKGTLAEYDKTTRIEPIKIGYSQYKKNIKG